MMCPVSEKFLNSRPTPSERSEKVAATMAERYEKLTDYQKKAYVDVPEKHRPMYLKAHTTSSMAAAIRAACCQCFGYDDLVDAIPECTSESCPLWTHRKGHK